MLTEKNYRDFCDEETENELVKLGFPIEHACLQGIGIYVTIHISLYEAQKWLREERGILLQPTYLELSDEWICVIRDKNKRHGYSTKKQKNYEEVLLEGIKEAIRISEEKSNVDFLER